jgi:CRP-like cAMP-binding protein
MRKALYILGGMKDDDIEWMLRVASRRTLRAGEMLIHEGESIDALYIVMDGSFDVFLAGANGRHIAKLGAGEVLGEISLVDARPPSASVRAATESTVLALPRHLLQAHLESDQGFAARFYRALSLFLADRLKDTVAQMGYGAEDRLHDEGDEDELDLDRLESASRGGIHFDRLLQRSGRI